MLVADDRLGQRGTPPEVWARGGARFGESHLKARQTESAGPDPAAPRCRTRASTHRKGQLERPWPPDTPGQLQPINGQKGGTSYGQTGANANPPDRHDEAPLRRGVLRTVPLDPARRRPRRLAARRRRARTQARQAPATLDRLLPDVRRRERPPRQGAPMSA